MNMSSKIHIFDHNIYSIMKKQILIGLSLISLFAVQSCKETTDPEPTKSKTELLCASPWKTTAATIDPALNVGGTLISDFYSQYEPCDKDDLTKFESNKTGMYDEGATKCDPMDPQSDPFTWTFDLTETKITIDGETADIVQLDASTFKYSMVMDGADIGGTSGVKYKITFTEKH